MATVINGNTGIDKVQDSVVSGHVIQVANYTTGAMATSTALIPFDNTSPQITEGSQFMSLSFTPKKANSKLKIDVVANFSNSVNNSVILALFRDTTANAFASSVVGCSSVGDSRNCVITYVLDAISTNLTTISLRIGGLGAGTTTFNGHNGADKFNNTYASSITITEIAQ